MSGQTAELGATSALERLLHAFGGDVDAHVRGGPSSDAEVDQLENVLGAPLPPPVRFFLTRLGAGLYFLGHEVFGPRRVMIHDIELVPDILSVRARLAADGFDPLAHHLLPIHRYVQRIHLVELDDPRGPVVDAARTVRYPDFTSFVGTVVLSRPQRAGAR